MEYIIINFKTAEDIDIPLKRLLEMGYYFSCERVGLERTGGIENFNKIKSALTTYHIISGPNLGVSIILGTEKCNMQWSLRYRTFASDRDYLDVVTIEEFIKKYKDYEHPRYRKDILGIDKIEDI